MGRLGEGVMDVLSKAVDFSHGFLREEEVEGFCNVGLLDLSVQIW